MDVTQPIGVTRPQSWVNRNLAVLALVAAVVLLSFAVLFLGAMVVYLVLNQPPAVAAAPVSQQPLESTVFVSPTPTQVQPLVQILPTQSASPMPTITALPTDRPTLVPTNTPSPTEPPLEPTNPSPPTKEPTEVPPEPTLPPAPAAWPPVFEGNIAEAYAAGMGSDCDGGDEASLRAWLYSQPVCASGQCDTPSNFGGIVHTLNGRTCYWWPSTVPAEMGTGTLVVYRDEGGQIFWFRVTSLTVADREWWKNKP